jgi:hypothetical protein
LDARLRRSKRTNVKQGAEYRESNFDAQYDKYYGTQGTKHFQKKYKQGFSMLQSKYTQAISLLGVNMKKDKEAIFVSDMFEKAVGTCFNQMPASKGIKIYGERALVAMVK